MTADPVYLFQFWPVVIIDVTLVDNSVDLVD